MDDEETVDEVYYPACKRHDRWSLVVLGLNYARQITVDTANFLGELTIAASQHAGQVSYDKRFENMTEKFNG